MKSFSFSASDINLIRSGDKKDHVFFITGLKKNEEFHSFNKDGNAIFINPTGERLIKNFLHKGMKVPAKEPWQQECEEIQIAGGDWSNSYFKATGEIIYKADGYVLPKGTVSFSFWKTPVTLPKDKIRYFVEIIDVRCEKIKEKWSFIYDFKLL